MRYYSYKVITNVANYNGPFNTNQVITINQTSVFMLKWASVTVFSLVSSTAKGAMRSEAHAVLNLYGSAVSQPLVKVANITDSIGANTLNGIVLSCNTNYPFQGKVQIPAAQQLIVETINMLPAALYAGFASADITNVTLSTTVVIGWDDNVNDQD